MPYLSDRGVRYFFYGTLMDAEVRIAVLGPGASALPVESARLAGYRRLYMRGASYPVLVATDDPTEAAVVDGLLVHRIDAAAEQRLIRFEGDAYRLGDVTVERRRSGTVCARCFLPLTDNLADSRPWDPNTWRRRDRALYVSRIRRRAIAAG
jgi:AIG2-like family.